MNSNGNDVFDDIDLCICVCNVDVIELLRYDILFCIYLHNMLLLTLLNEKRNWKMIDKLYCNYNFLFCLLCCLSALKTYA